MVINGAHPLWLLSSEVADTYHTGGCCWCVFREVGLTSPQLKISALHHPVFQQASFLNHRINTCILTYTLFISNRRLKKNYPLIKVYKDMKYLKLFSALCGSWRASLNLADCFGILCSLLSKTLLTLRFFFFPSVDSVLHRGNNSLWSLHLSNPFSVADSWKWNCVFQNEIVEMLRVRNCVVTLKSSNFSIGFICSLTNNEQTQQDDNEILTLK